MELIKPKKVFLLSLIFLSLLFSCQQNSDNGEGSLDFELFLMADKSTVVADGNDEVKFTLTLKEPNGNSKTVTPDRITGEDSNGNPIEIGGAAFRTYKTGTFSLTAEYATKRSNAVSITASELVIENEQVANLSVFQREGQSFLTWDEVYPVINSTSITLGEYKEKMENFPKEINYRIYRDTSPIVSLEGLSPIKEISSSSCWNSRYYGQGNDEKSKDKKIERFIITQGDNPLPPGTGLFVHTPKEDVNAYYAVTAVIDGIEAKALTTKNSSAAVAETNGQGVPVLQKVEKVNHPEHFQYIYNSTINYYVRWEAPPNCNINGQPYNYIVAVPPNVTNPAPVGLHLHCWGGNMKGGYGWWSDAEDGALLVASNQYPYDWWTGYHEKLFTNEKPSTQAQWEDGIVRPYSQTRMNSFIDWMDSSTSYNIDRKRTFVAGTSMGGSGSIMMAIRHPDKYAWTRSWVGVHDPSNSPNFTKSYASVYGPLDYNVKFEDGSKVWDYFNDIWHLKNHREVSVGFISFSNGKNDSAIGWEQAVDFVNTLQETKQPHLFIWGQAGHGERSVMPKNGSERVMPIDIRIDQTLPAFTNCSLDDNPGNGDPAIGDQKGQINRYLYWDTDTIIDTPSNWQMTFGLIDNDKSDTCTVDVTPRRCQQFTPPKGSTISWTLNDATSGSTITNGTTVVDEYGLITIKGITVTKNKVTLKIQK